VSMAFVGAEKALEYERLYSEEALDEWVLEWNTRAVQDAQPDVAPEFRPMPETSDELIPF